MKANHLFSFSITTMPELSNYLILMHLSSLLLQLLNTLIYFFWVGMFWIIVFLQKMLPNLVLIHFMTVIWQKKMILYASEFIRHLPSWVISSIKSGPFPEIFLQPKSRLQLHICFTYGLDHEQIFSSSTLWPFHHFGRG